MAENRQIPTDTIVTVDNFTSTATIFTFYTFSCVEGGDLPTTIFALITDQNGSQNGVPFIAGEALIGVKTGFGTTWSLDIQGNLNIFTPTNDAEQYSIDSDGNLIYTCL